MISIVFVIWVPCCCVCIQPLQYPKTSKREWKAFHKIHTRRNLVYFKAKTQHPLSRVIECFVRVQLSKKIVHYFNEIKEEFRLNPRILSPISVPHLTYEVRIRWFLEVLFSARYLSWIFMPYAGWNYSSAGSTLFRYFRYVLFYPDIPNLEDRQENYFPEFYSFGEFFWTSFILVPAVVILSLPSWRSKRIIRFYPFCYGKYFTLLVQVTIPGFVWYCISSAFFCGSSIFNKSTPGFWVGCNSYEQYVWVGIFFYYMLFGQALLLLVHELNNIQFLWFEHPYYYFGRIALFEFFIPVVSAGVMSIFVSPRIYLWFHLVFSLILLGVHSFLQSAIGHSASLTVNNFRTGTLFAGISGAIISLIRANGTPFCPPEYAIMISFVFFCIGYNVNKKHPKNLPVGSKEYFDEIAVYLFEHQRPRQVFDPFLLTVHVSNLIISDSLLNICASPHCLFDDWKMSSDNFRLHISGNFVNPSLAPEVIQSIQDASTPPSHYMSLLYPALPPQDLNHISESIYLASSVEVEQNQGNIISAFQPGQDHIAGQRIAALFSIRAINAIEFTDSIAKRTYRYHSDNPGTNSRPPFEPRNSYTFFHISSLPFTPEARRASQIAQLGIKNVPSHPSNRPFELPLPEICQNMAESKLLRNALLYGLLLPPGYTRYPGSYLPLIIHLLGAFFNLPQIYHLTHNFWCNSFRTIIQQQIPVFRETVQIILVDIINDSILRGQAEEIGGRAALEQDYLLDLYQATAHNNQYLELD